MSALISVRIVQVDLQHEFLLVIRSMYVFILDKLRFSMTSSGLLRIIIPGLKAYKQKDLKD